MNPTFAISCIEIPCCSMTTSRPLPDRCLQHWNSFASNAFIHSLSLSLLVYVWLVTWKNGCCYFARLNFNFLACGQIQTTFLILVLFSSCLHRCFCFFVFIFSAPWFCLVFRRFVLNKNAKDFCGFEPVSSENTRPHQKFAIMSTFVLCFCPSKCCTFSAIFCPFRVLFQECTTIFYTANDANTTIKGFDGFVVKIWPFDTIATDKQLKMKWLQCAASKWSSLFLGFVAHCMVASLRFKFRR